MTAQLGGDEQQRGCIARAVYDAINRGRVRTAVSDDDWARLVSLREKLDSPDVRNAFAATDRIVAELDGQPVVIRRGSPAWDELEGVFGDPATSKVALMTEPDAPDQVKVKANEYTWSPPLAVTPC